MSSAEVDLSEVPIFPLPLVVLFPGAALPLHVFEPRYRVMLHDCLTKHGGTIVIAQVDRSGERISEVAGVGSIIEHQPLPDGRSNIFVLGLARVRLDEILPEDLPRYPYKRARASKLVSAPDAVSEGDRSALVAAATMFATEVKKHDPGFAFNVPNVDDAGALADMCAFHLVVDAPVRQALLEELDPRVRVRRVVDQLALQQSAMLSEARGAVLN